LENRRSKDNKVSRRIYKAVESKVGKARVAKAKVEYNEKRRKEIRTEKRGKKTKKKRMIEVKKMAEKWKICIVEATNQDS